jgi:WhiB family redox-sensing transcriptional regulator
VTAPVRGTRLTDDRPYEPGAVEAANDRRYATPRLDTSWMRRAICGPFAYLFHAPSGERPEERRERETNAVAVCRRCPVKPECRAYAAAEGKADGVWGGLRERQVARARTASKARAS